MPAENHLALGQEGARGPDDVVTSNRQQACDPDDVMTSNGRSPGALDAARLMFRLKDCFHPRRTVSLTVVRNFAILGSVYWQEAAGRRPRSEESRRPTGSALRLCLSAGN